MDTVFSPDGKRFFFLKQHKERHIQNTEPTILKYSLPILLHARITLKFHTIQIVLLVE